MPDPKKFIRPRQLKLLFKDRNPTWIPIQLDEILDSDDYAELKDASKGQLLGIRCLYARARRPLPIKTLARKIGATGKIDFDALAPWIEFCDADVEDFDFRKARVSKPDQGATDSIPIGEEKRGEEIPAPASVPKSDLETQPVKRAPTFTDGPRGPSEDPEFRAIWDVAITEVWSGDQKGFIGNKREAWQAYRHLGADSALQERIADYLHSLTEAPRYGLERLLEAREWEEAKPKAESNGTAADHAAPRPADWFGAPIA